MTRALDAKPAGLVLRELSFAMRVSRALAAAAELGLADALANGLGAGDRRLDPGCGGGYIPPDIDGIRGRRSVARGKDDAH